MLLAGLSLCPASQAAESAQRIQEMIRQGDLVAALSLLRQSLEKSPRDGGLYNLQGVIQAQQGDSAGSEASFKRALELAPLLEGAYLNLGHLYQERFPKEPSARDNALRVYAQLLSFEPDNNEANYQSAVLFMQKERYASSLQHLSKLPPDVQARSQVLSVRCGDYAGFGEEAKAAEVADQMLRSPDLAEPDVTMLLPLLARQKKTALAVRLLEGLEKRELVSFASLHSLGLLYRQEGRLEEARRVLLQAAQMQPVSVPVLLELAQVANDQHDSTGALGYLAHARDLEPHNAAIQFFWGMVCVEQNLTHEAFDALAKAVSLEPNNAYYNYALGAVALTSDQARQAIPYFQKYCELRPNDPRGRLALGIAYFDNHDDDNALDTITSIKENPETAAGAHYYLGRIANQKGDYEEAVRQLQRALQGYPDYADAYAELGLIHLKRKEYPQAEEALDRALQINPTGYVANLNLMILYQRTKDPREEEQAKRFELVKEERAKRMKEFLRTIKVEP